MKFDIGESNLSAQTVTFNGKFTCVFACILTETY